MKYNIICQCSRHFADKFHCHCTNSVKFYSYNNFTLYSSGLSIFLRETGSVFSLPTSTKLVPEGENYFSGSNTRLRRSSLLPLWSFGELTNNRFALQGEIISLLVVPLVPRTHTPRSTCAGAGWMHVWKESHTRNTEEEPRLWESNATPWDPPGWTAALPKSHSTLRTLRSVMVVVLSPLVYTAKVTDHHGSDFSSRTPPHRRSGAVLEWSIDFVEFAYEQTYWCLYRRSFNFIS